MGFLHTVPLLYKVVSEIFPKLATFFAIDFSARGSSIKFSLPAPNDQAPLGFYTNHIGEAGDRMQNTKP